MAWKLVMLVVRYAAPRMTVGEFRDVVRGFADATCQGSAGSATLIVRERSGAVLSEFRFAHDRPGG